jgi:hypothetical protein
MRALLHQPIVDFPLEHQDIFTKEKIVARAALRGNLVKVLGQQSSIPARAEWNNHVVAIHR